MHGGTNQGAPAGNQNATDHGAYADPVNLYDHLSETEREWVDALTAAYVERGPFDADDPRAERVQMACIIMYQEWAAREAVLRQGMSEDVTVGVTDEGQPVVRTDEHHLTKTASRHNTDARMMLKDLGCLETQKRAAQELGQSLASALADTATDHRP